MIVRTVQQQALCVEHNLVVTRPKQLGNLPGRLKTSQLQEALIGADSLSNQLGRLSFSLSANDDGLRRTSFTRLNSRPHLRECSSPAFPG